MRTIPKKKPDGKIEPFLSKDENNRTISKDSKGNVTLHIERKYELITPLFGGGVEAGKNDEITLINGKAIRGHLRFWWRATRGGQFGGGAEGLKKMREREAEIWGAASTLNKPSPSQVRIEIEIKDKEKGQDKSPFSVEGYIRDGKRKIKTVSHSNIAPPYAAFPLQPPEKGRYEGMPTKTVKVGAIFTLKLSFPQKIKLKSNEIDIQKDIEAALWAWETFGGIGARTRRGFGALQLIEKNGEKVEPYKADIKDIEKNILAGLKEYVEQGEWHPAVPHLSRNADRFKVTFLSSVNDAWNGLIGKLKEFRQDRSGTQRDPGRSKWTEPDQIRDKTNQMFAGHENPIHEDLIYDDCMLFPRAAFGLPIAFPFHYQQSNQQRPHRENLDPAKTKLTLTNSDRWASPLLLRPLACKNNKAVGLAIILDSVIPEAMKLIYEDTEEIVSGCSIQVALDDDEAKAITPLKGNKDVLDAFLKFLSKESNK